MDAGVPAVQSLVQSGTTKVPKRFVRPINDRPCPGKGVHLEQDEIPTIDASRLEDSEELEKLHKACAEWGFFQLIGHGIPSSLLESTGEVIKGFFNLPQEEKNSYTGVYGLTGKEGYGRYFLPSEDTVLDWGDVFFHLIPPAVIEWPVSPPQYKEIIQAYGVEVESLAVKLLAALSRAIGQEPNFFYAAFGPKPRTALRMNYYPPCPEPELVLGLSPHSDGVGITILLQDKVEGLEIKKNGEWKLVKSIPNAFVVNIGDIVEIMSNGTYKSVEHRAVVSYGKARISAATFYTPDPEVTLKPLIADEKPKFKEMPLREFAASYLSKELTGKAHLEFASI